MNKIGCVLSGGGARGFAHLGVLKLLNELNVKPYAIAGTSAGAIAGALYASGKSPDEILELMKNNIFFGWSNIAWRQEGFFSMNKLKKLLEDSIRPDDFKALKIKLFVAATDLVKGESIIFSKGKLADAVIASASVPVVFEAVKMNDKLLVDGGVMNNFPIEPLTKICNVIIGSYVNKVEAGIGNGSAFKTANILDRCFHLAIAGAVYSKTNQCDVFIEVPLHNFDMYDVKKADMIFDIGYKAALQHIEKLKTLV
jgi:NTE family protein